MEPETFYHIYNRGNNGQNIFLTKQNYLFFKRKIERHLLPHLDIVAYCLMPNHFHFLVYTKENITKDKFSNDLRVMLRSYTRAINKQECRTGSLFQQHTKMKALDVEGENHTMTQSHSMTGQSIDDYPITCFHYIHQNPMKAGLVHNMEDWEMSSFQDYTIKRKNTLCNKQIAYKFLEIPETPVLFIELSYQIMSRKD